MSQQLNFSHRLGAAFGAMAMTAIMLASYFATPQAQVVSGMLA